MRQTKTALLQSIEERLKQFEGLKEQVAQLSALEKQQQDLASQGRELSLRSMAELEVLEAEDRAAGLEPEPLPEEQVPAGGQAVADATSSFDWSTFDALVFPVGWPPSVDPGSSDGIPPASQGNSNS